MYEKYKSWCADAIEKTGAAVEGGKADIKELESTILELTAKTSKLKVLIEKSTKDMKHETKALKELEEVSAEEAATLTSDIKELAQMIKYLQGAITVLQGAQRSRGDNVQAGHQGDALLELPHGAEALVGIGAAVRNLPVEKRPSPRKMALVEAFLSDMQKAKAANKVTYTPQSSQILGMLEEMLENCKEQLDLKQKEKEATGSGSKEFLAAKTKEVQGLRMSRKELLEEKVEAEAGLAAAQRSYDDSVDALKADKKFLADTKLACQAKDAEYKAREKFRQEELEAVNKAIDILNSDDAKKLFSESMGEDAAKQVSFLQVGNDADRSPSAQAFRVLKTAASHSSSLRLAQLAAQVSAASGQEAFKEVTAEIDKVIAVLKKEGQADIEWRDGCKDKYQDITSSVETLDWKIEKNNAKITKLEELIKAKETETAKTITELEDMAKEIAEMEDQRKEENAKFLKAKSDDEKAIELVESAKETLARFYESRGKGNIRSKLIQEASHAAAPAAATVEYKEPPQFAKTDKNKGASKSIVQLMEMIIEDIQIAIIDDIKYEEAAQAEYNTAMKNSKKIVEELEAKKVTLKNIIADSNENKAEEEETLQSNEDDLKDENDFHDKIKKNCDWILDRFELRAKARAEEMDAMVQVKDYLSGAAVPSLLQRAGSFLPRRSG